MYVYTRRLSSSKIQSITLDCNTKFSITLLTTTLFIYLINGVTKKQFQHTPFNVVTNKMLNYHYLYHDHHINHHHMKSPLLLVLLELQQYNCNNIWPLTFPLSFLSPLSMSSSPRLSTPPTCNFNCYLMILFNHF